MKIKKFNEGFDKENSIIDEIKPVVKQIKQEFINKIQNVDVKDNSDISFDLKILFHEEHMSQVIEDILNKNNIIFRKYQGYFNIYINNGYTYLKIPLIYGESIDYIEYYLWFNDNVITDHLSEDDIEHLSKHIKNFKKDYELYMKTKKYNL